MGKGTGCKPWLNCKCAIFWPSEDCFSISAVNGSFLTLEPSAGCPKCMNPERLSESHKHGLNTSRRRQEHVGPRVSGSASSTVRYGPFCSQGTQGEVYQAAHSAVSDLCPSPHTHLHLSAGTAWNDHLNSWERWRKAQVCNQLIRFLGEDLIRSFPYSPTSICIDGKGWNSAYSPA